MWGGYHQHEDRRGMGKAQEWMLVKVQAEDDGYY